MKEKYKKCNWCKDFVEKHHFSLHEQQCYLRPENLKLICSYLESGITKPKLLSRASFYKFSIANNILTSITITNRMHFSNWNTALYQLLVYGYLSGFIQYEKVDLILALITDTLLLPIPIYQQFYRNAVENEQRNKGIVTDDLHYNAFLLLMCIVKRSLVDLELNVGDKDENKKAVDLPDAASFLVEFAPEVIKKNWNKFSDDAKTILLTSIG